MKRTVLAILVAISALALATPAVAGDLPKPAKKDAKLEGEMVAAMTAKWKGDTILKAIIVEKGWTDETVVSKGKQVVVARRIAAKIASKVKSGKCRLFEVTFRQAKNGGKYGPTEYHSVGGSEDISCDSVK